LISLPALALQRQFYLARGANVILFRFTIVPAGGTRLPIGDNEKFGTFSL
jgi:hypothetical protein